MLHFLRAVLANTIGRLLEVRKMCPVASVRVAKRAKGERRSEWLEGRKGDGQRNRKAGDLGSKLRMGLGGLCPKLNRCKAQFGPKAAFPSPQSGAV